MKDPSKLSWKGIAIAAVMVGLTIGLGVSQVKLKKEEKLFRDKLSEAERKISFIQKKSEQDKAVFSDSMAQETQEEVNKLDKVVREKDALSARVKRLKAGALTLQLQVKASDEASAEDEKALESREQDKRDLTRQLRKTTKTKETLRADLKKTKTKMQALASDLTNASQSLGQCQSNNAALSLIAEELLNKYRSKGLGAVLMQKEPLTQIERVELEHFVQKYKDEIEREKIRKKDVEKNEDQ